MLPAAKGAAMTESPPVKDRKLDTKEGAAWERGEDKQHVVYRVYFRKG